MDVHLKKNRMILLLFSMIAFLLLSCSNDMENDIGDLSISIDRNIGGRTVSPAPSDRDASSWRITATRDDDHSLDFVHTSDTKDIEIKGIKVGLWTMKAEALAADGVVIAESDSESVNVEAVAKAHASFTLHWRTDRDGMLHASISVPASDTSVSKVQLDAKCLFNDALSRTLVIPISESRSQEKPGYFVFHFDESLPAGHYDIEFRVFGTDGLPIGTAYRESLHIMSERNSAIELPWRDGMFMKAAAPRMRVEKGMAATDDTLVLSSDDGGEIRYTVDGSLPSSSSSLYASPLVLDHTMTVKARAYRDGMMHSEITENHYVVTTPNPVFSRASVNTSYPFHVTISDRLSDAVIMYTTDGTEPSADNGTKYGGEEILIEGSVTLKAIALAPGREPSGTVMANYVVNDMMLEGDIVPPALDRCGISISVPSEFTSGNPIPVKGTYTFSATLTETGRMASSYEWFIDGKLIEGATGSNLTMGIADGNGARLRKEEFFLTVRAVVDGRTISDGKYLPKRILDMSEFRIGDRGMAGGYIFYDIDADDTPEDPDGPDNRTSSVEGWRFLEAAPQPLKRMVFGMNVHNQYVNGKFEWDPSCTGKGIGDGLRNTKLLYYFLGDEAWESVKYSTNYKTKIYPAKMCWQLEQNGVDDWFLPSYMEMNAMTKCLKSINVSMPDGAYWTSSEDETDRVYAYTDYTTADKEKYYGVWPARRF